MAISAPLCARQCAQEADGSTANRSAEQTHGDIERGFTEQQICDAPNTPTDGAG